MTTQQAAVQQPEPVRVNGVNVTGLFDTIKAVKADNELAKFRFDQAERHEIRRELRLALRALCLDDAAGGPERGTVVARANEPVAAAAQPGQRRLSRLLCLRYGVLRGQRAGGGPHQAGEEGGDGCISSHRPVPPLPSPGDIGT